MTDYTALINKWATLNPGTTAQKLAQINAITVTGAIPTTIYVTADQVANCISWAEFKVLTAQKQSNLLALLNTPGQLLGGSSHIDSLLVGMLLDAFSPAGTTITNLTALAQGIVQSWSQANGYGGTIGMNDLILAGGLI